MSSMSMHAELDFEASAVALETLAPESRGRRLWRALGPRPRTEAAEAVSNRRPDGHRSCRSQMRMLARRLPNMTGLPSLRAIRTEPGRFALWLSVILALYWALWYGVVIFSGSFAVSGGVVSPWYPPAGVNLALFLWCGPICAPVVYAAEVIQIIVYVPTPLPVGAYCVFLVFKVIYYVLEASVLLMIDPCVSVSSPLKALRFVAVTAVTHFIIGSSFVVFLKAVNFNPPYGPTVASWLLGDLTGVYAVTVTFLELRRLLMRIREGKFVLQTTMVGGVELRWAYLWIRLILLAVVSAVLLWTTFWPISSSGPRFYLIMLPLVFASLFFGIMGSSIWFGIVAFSTLLAIYYNPDLLVGSVEQYQVALLIFALSSLFMGSEQERAREYQILSANARARAEELTRARNRLLEMVAHDIKTPIHGMQGMLEYLRQSPQLSQSDVKCVTTAQHSCSVLNQIVGDVLAFRRLESVGDFPIVQELFSARDLTILMDDVIDLFSTASEELSLTLNCRYPFRAWQSTESIYLGDLLRLRQVLTNLVSNAVKFTLHGYIELNLTGFSPTAPRSLGGGPCLEMFNIQCVDSGRGMTEEMIASLFNPYEQHDLDDERKRGGSGLGLYISHKIMNIMGGSLLCTSEPGHGTTFSVRFPAHVAPLSMEHPGVKIPRLKGNARLYISSRDVEFRKYLIECAVECTADLVQERPEAMILDLSGGQEAATGLKASRILVVLDLKQTVPEKRLYEDPNVVVFVAFKPLHPCTVYAFLCVPDSLPSMTHGNFSRVLSPPSSLEEKAFVAEMSRRRSSMKTNEGNIIDDELFAPPTFDKVRVLIVDDTSINLKVAQRLLGILLKGAKVETAQNGYEAVDKFERDGPYSAILMDLMMPICDGFEACSSIRRLEKQLGVDRVPIIALTAAGDEVGDRALAGGFDGYLAKPFTAAQLRQCLQRHGGSAFRALYISDESISQ